MKTCIAILVLLLALADTARAHLGDDHIVAPILNNIAIDGDLSDWPAHMEEHYVLNHGQAYGPTDIDTADLTASLDLTPKFKVGYSPTTQLLYVAATVRDDQHVLDLEWPPGGDNVEIYVDGDHNGGQYRPDRQLHQYAGLAGDVLIPAPFIGDNLYLFNHDIRKTRSLMAHDRSGDVTTYEWAIEVFDLFPHQPTHLAPGKMIGFDVAVIDKDDDGGNTAWVCWGFPYASFKVGNADLLGDLLLGEETVADIENGGSIAGAATDADTGTPLAGLVLAAYQGDRLLSRARTDARGGFRFYLPSGTYALKLQRGQGYRLEPITSTVEVGRETATDLSLMPIRLPAALEKSAALYAGLQSYGDSIEVEINAGLQGAAAAFAWQDRDRVRLESIDWDSGNGSAVYSDGLEQTWYETQFQQYVQQEAGGRPRFADIPRIMPGLRLVQQLLLSDDPRAFLLQGLDKAQQVGREDLDGRSTTVVDLALIATGGSLLNAVGFGSTRLRLWLDAETAALRQVSYDHNDEQFVERYHHIELNPTFAADYFRFNAPEGAEHAFRMGEGKGSEELIGQAAPTFSLVDSDEEEVRLADFSGQVLMIDFWGTWCAPCRAATSSLNELHATYADQGFNIIGISTHDEPETVRRYAADHEVAFPLPLADNTVAGQYGVTGFPTALFVDKQGVVRYVHRGFNQDMKTAYIDHIEQLLAE